MPDPLGDISFTWPFYAAAVLGYLLGSVPFGLVLSWMAGHGDIRRIGSGNIGATNVLRTGNRPLALATLILDSGKGALAVLIAARWGPDMAVLAGGGAVLGHVFPIWLRFKGGKGVATALGTLIAIAPVVGALACLVWLATARAFRYSSLAAIVAMISAPLWAWLFAQGPVMGRFLADPQRMELAAFIAVVVLVRHAGNIARLLRGREPRIGEPRASATEGGTEDAS